MSHILNNIKRRRKKDEQNEGTRPKSIGTLHKPEIRKTISIPKILIPNKKKGDRIPPSKATLDKTLKLASLSAQSFLS